MRRGLGLVLLVDIALVLVSGVSILHAPVLALEVRPGPGEECPWTVEAGCLASLGGVPVRAESFVTHPTMLPDAAAQQRWRADQDAMRAVLRPGERVFYTVKGSLEPGSVLVHEQRLDWLLPLFLPVAGTGLLMILIGTWVLLRGQGGPAIALFVICQSALLCMVPEAVFIFSGAVVPEVMHTIQHFPVVGVISGVLALLYLAATFPRLLIPQVWVRRLGSLSVGLGVAAVAVYLSGELAVVGLIAVPSVLVAISLLILGIWRPGRQAHRLQGLWVLWGLLVPVLVKLIVMYASDEVENSPLLKVLPLLSLNAIAVGICMAVLRHRLLGIQLILRRTLVGAGVFGAAMFAFNLTISAFAGSMAPGGEYEAIFFTAAALTLMLTPLQARLERGLDRLFLRNRFHYRRLLARMPEDLAVIRSSEGVVRYALERLVRYALERVGGVMELEAVVMVLSPSFSGDRVWRRTRGRSVRSADIGGLPWGAMSALEVPALCRPESPDPLNRWMVEEGLEIAVPMRTPEGLMGVLLCSGFPSRRAFDSDDVEALLTAAGGLALSLGHTLSYERIQLLNAELEERIEQRTAQLNAATVKLYSQEKMASLGVLAAGVAHELNTPIGVVLSTSEMLARVLPEDHRASRMSQLCRDAARRAAEIVSDLRSFSRPELQGLEQIDLVESIDITLRLLSGRLRDAGIEVERRIDAQAIVEGSPAMINQTISNLTRNAVQAMEPDGGRLIIGVRQLEDVVQVSIEDSGPGISEELRARIFEPFFTTRGPGEGTGLGLSLCFTFVEQHHGRIWEEGTVGVGARFVVELPIRQPREELSHE